jgi:hypothetical protein
MFSNYCVISFSRFQFSKSFFYFFESQRHATVTTVKKLTMASVVSSQGSIFWEAPSGYVFFCNFFVNNSVLGNIIGNRVMSLANVARV